jgi:Fe2+ or Zn2+ uptake regulation protein
MRLRRASTTDLTPCEHDCLALLAQQRRPLKATLIRAKLEAAGRLWSLVSVKRHLAQLRRSGLVDNTQKHPKGYFIPEAVLPILRAVSST